MEKTQPAHETSVTVNARSAQDLSIVSVLNVPLGTIFSLMESRAHPHAQRMNTGPILRLGVANPVMPTASPVQVLPISYAPHETLDISCKMQQPFVMTFDLQVPTRMGQYVQHVIQFVVCVTDREKLTANSV